MRCWGAPLRSRSTSSQRLARASAADQVRWLRTVRNACGDDACLQRAYRLRLGELNPFQPGASFVKDVPSGPALVAAVPPGANIRTVDAPDNPDPKPMTAEGRLEEEGGGYVLTTASRAQFVVQNFYFSEAAIKQVSDILTAPGDRKRFRISGYRAAMPGQNVFEPRRCILIHRLPGLAFCSSQRERLHSRRNHNLYVCRNPATSLLARRSAVAAAPMAIIQSATVSTVL